MLVDFCVNLPVPAKGRITGAAFTMHRVLGTYSYGPAFSGGGDHDIPCCRDLFLWLVLPLSFARSPRDLSVNAPLCRHYCYWILYTLTRCGESVKKGGGSASGERLRRGRGC